MIKTTFHGWSILLLVSIMNALPVSSQEIDETTLYYYVETDVIDTLKLEAIKAEKVKQFNKEKQYKKDSLNNEIDMLSQLILIAARKQKIEDEQLYSFAAKIYEDYQEKAPELKEIYNSRRNDWGGWSSAIVTSVGEMQKEEDKVISMFKKKKVNRLFNPYLAALQNEKKKEVDKIESTKPNLSIASQDIPYKKGIKKERNPNNRAYWYVNNENHLDEIDKAIQMRGWEWLKTEKSEEINTMAPFAMTYNKYDSHPQYRVFNDKVFDNNGNLVYQAYLLRSDEKVINFLKEELKKEIYIADFKANKYDILETPAQTQESVKIMLGLPYKPSVDAKTAKKNQKIVDDYWKAQANEIKVAAGSRQQRIQARRKAKEAEAKMGAMLFSGLLDANLNSSYNTANHFKQKLEEDHKYDLGGIWKISRVSNTSFKIVFMNHYSSSYTGLATINQPKPYHWQWTIKLIPNDDKIVINRSDYLDK